MGMSALILCRRHIERKFYGEQLLFEDSEFFSVIRPTYRGDFIYVENMKVYVGYMKKYAENIKK